MTILSTLTTLQGPAVLLCVILGPSILPRILAYINRRRFPPPLNTTPPPPRPALPIIAKLILALHTAYRIYTLIQPPYNVFTTHNLPLFTSSEGLRRYLLPTQNASNRSPSIINSSSSLTELLLSKLANLDDRLLYSRYGHEALLGCTWCTSNSDYLLVALPRILGSYLAMAGLIGILGMEMIGGARGKLLKSAWRGSMSWILAVLAIGEVGVRYLWEIRITEGDAVQLDSVIHTIRTILLLLFPLAYTYLLPIPPSSQLESIIPILSKVQNTTSTLRLTSLARTTVLQDSELRQRILKSVDEEEVLRKIAMEDEHVKRAAEGLGMRDGMGGGARRWVDDGWNGLIKIGQGTPSG